MRATAWYVWGARSKLASALLMPRMSSLSIDPYARCPCPIHSLCTGHIGDRIGRRISLLLSILAMGLPTVLIGCLPNYAVGARPWGVLDVVCCANTSLVL